MLDNQTSGKIDKQSESIIFELYRILVEEYRHKHNEWINNFRILLTFNSIIIAGIFASFSFFVKNKPIDSMISIYSWGLFVISLFGISILFAVVHMIMKINDISRIRIEELKFLEGILYGSQFPIKPFCDGAILLDRLHKGCLDNQYSPEYEIKRAAFRLPYSWPGQYIIFGCLFVFYCLIFILSFLIRNLWDGNWAMYV